MAGMGPPPKANRQRRNATVAMTRLPAEGRSGKTPVWPLPDDVVTTVKLEMAQAAVERLTYELEDGPTPAKARAVERKLKAEEFEVAVLTKRLAMQRAMEKKLWRELWRTPQATMWERLSWTRDAAQYVRWKVQAELGDLDAAKEARQLSDRLGLTPLALLRLRWEIVAEEEAAGAGRRPSGAGSARPARASSDDPRALLHVV